MIIENDSLDSLGLSQFGLGVVLLLVNASTLVLAGSWCARRHLEERMKQRWRHAISDDEYTLLMRIMQQEESGDSSDDRDDDADEEVPKKIKARASAWRNKRNKNRKWRKYKDQSKR